MDDDGDDGEILIAGEWLDVEFDVALDTGCIVHIASAPDTPGYAMAESVGSKRGQNFTVGDGGQLPNLGEKVLNLETSGGQPLEAKFVIANVTRPLMSGGLICDQGHTILIDKKEAIVRNSKGVKLCTFYRQNGGLYIARMKLKAPFTGRG